MSRPNPGETWTNRTEDTSIRIDRLDDEEGLIHYEVIRDAGGPSIGSIFISQWQTHGPPSWGWRLKPAES